MARPRGVTFLAGAVLLAPLVLLLGDLADREDTQRCLAEGRPRVACQGGESWGLFTILLGVVVVAEAAMVALAVAVARPMPSSWRLARGLYASLLLVGGVWLATGTMPLLLEARVAGPLRLVATVAVPLLAVGGAIVVLWYLHLASVRAWYHRDAPPAPASL